MGASSDLKEDIPAVAAGEAVGGGSKPAGYSDAPPTPPSPVGHAGHSFAADDEEFDEEEMFTSCFGANSAVPSIAANSAVAAAAATAAESGTADAELAIVAFAPAVSEGAAGAVAFDAAEGAIVAPPTEGAIVAPATEGAIVAPAAEGAIVAPPTEGAIVAPATEGAIVAPAAEGAIVAPPAEDPDEYERRVHIAKIQSAPSGNSACRVCMKKIAKNTARFMINSGDTKYARYVHAECLEGFQEIDRLNMLRDLDRLRIHDSDLKDEAMEIYLKLQDPPI